MKQYLLSIALVFCIARPALAADAARASAPLPAWDVRPVMNREGRSDFCVMDRLYPEGRKVTIALSPKDEINLGVLVPKAGFIRGRQYDLDVQLGANAPRHVRGAALSGDEILLRLRAGEGWAEMFTASDNLTIGSGNSKMPFPLPNIKQAFATLRDCTHGTMPAASAAAGTLPANLKNILQKAGFTKYEVLPLDQWPPERRPADYGWKMGTLYGGFREKEVPAGTTLADLAGLHMGALKDKCAGAFKAALGRAQQKGRITMQKASAECGFASGNSVTVAILYALSGNRFAVFTEEAPIADKAKAEAARDALAKAVE